MENNEIEEKLDFQDIAKKHMELMNSQFYSTHDEIQNAVEVTNHNFQNESNQNSFNQNQRNRNENAKQLPLFFIDFSFINQDLDLDSLNSENMKTHESLEFNYYIQSTQSKF